VYLWQDFPMRGMGLAANLRCNNPKSPMSHNGQKRKWPVLLLALAVILLGIFITWLEG
jgi:hypothetical protein